MWFLEVYFILKSKYFNRLEKPELHSLAQTTETWVISPTKGCFIHAPLHLNKFLESSHLSQSNDKGLKRERNDCRHLKPYSNTFLKKPQVLFRLTSLDYSIQSVQKDDFYWKSHLGSTHSYLFSMPSTPRNSAHKMPSSGVLGTSNLVVSPGHQDW